MWDDGIARAAAGLTSLEELAPGRRLVLSGQAGARIRSLSTT
jgi:hypothetical protein